jgi:hypothetical protein
MRRQLSEHRLAYILWRYLGRWYRARRTLRASAKSRRPAAVGSNALANRERQRAVRQAVLAVRANMGSPIGDDALRASYAQASDLAELLAIVAAEARAQGGDEVTWAEIVLRAADVTRETMLEAESTLALLGYP